MTIGQFGVTAALVAGQMTLRLPQQCIFWFVQNQSVLPLKVTFISPDWGRMSSIVLRGAAYEGAPGGYLDSIGFPYFSPEGVELESEDLTAAFGSGASGRTPVNVFPYPGTGPSSFGS